MPDAIFIVSAVSRRSCAIEGPFQCASNAAWLA
jgi:hypothetical protein